jgi:hypothetical protein
MLIFQDFGTTNSLQTKTDFQTKVFVLTLSISDETSFTNFSRACLSHITLKLILANQIDNVDIIAIITNNSTKVKPVFFIKKFVIIIKKFILCSMSSLFKKTNFQIFF